jgi:uncharacterized protein (DUF362 family)
MSERGSGITRRGLLGGIAGGAAALALGRPRLAYPAPAGKARIVRVECDRIWRGDARDPKVVAAMVERGLMALSGAADLAAAWRHYVKPEQRVGLKINVLGRPLIYTAPEITEACVVGLMAAGVKPERILVWDRHKSHFGPTRYKLGKGGHGESIEAGAQYHKSVALKGSKGSAALDTIMTNRTDVTVNLPVLKDHRSAGMTLALKNIAFGCYDHYTLAHLGHCEPFISESYEHCVRQAKMQIPLIILDATSACYDDGPRPSDAGRLWRENAIYFATDPVALDVVCRSVINAKRREKGLADKTGESHHIENAAKKGLGVGDPARIEVVKIRV